MKKNLHYFGEFGTYIADDKEQEKEVKLYLELWKKYLIQKLSNECYSVKLIDEQWITRDPLYSGILCNKVTLALKLAVEIEFKFEVTPLDAPKYYDK
jgi:hypothetical protein